MAGTCWLKGALVAGIACAAALAWPGIGAAAVTSPASGSITPAPGSVQWSSDHPGPGTDVTVDPHNGDVFALGTTFLVAYDPADGSQLWSNRKGAGLSMAVSQNGQVVFVIRSATGSADYFTTALSAATGKVLWSARYNGPANGADRPTAVAVSPSGNAVFVTGTSQGKTSLLDFATVAYATSTGKQLWASRYNGQAHSHDAPAAIAANPNGSAVYVTGVSFGSFGSRFATVAYSATSGKSIWTRTYDKPSKKNAAGSVAVSRDGRRVFVTGGSDKTGSGLVFNTVAYSAASGTQQWAQRYQAAPHVDDESDLVLFSQHDGGKVIVVGRDKPTNAGAQKYVAVAYTVTGQRRWVKTFGRSTFTQVRLLGAALSHDGSNLYLTGQAFAVGGGEEPSRSLTIAASVRQGTQLWSQVVSTDSEGGPIAVSPDDASVYVGVQGFTTTTASFTTFSLRA